MPRSAYPSPSLASAYFLDVARVSYRSDGPRFANTSTNSPVHAPRCSVHYDCSELLHLSMFVFSAESPALLPEGLLPQHRVVILTPRARHIQSGASESENQWLVGYITFSPHDDGSSMDSSTSLITRARFEATQSACAVRVSPCLRTTFHWRRSAPSLTAASMVFLMPVSPFANALPPTTSGLTSQ